MLWANSVELTDWVKTELTHEGPLADSDKFRFVKSDLPRSFPPHFLHARLCQGTGVVTDGLFGLFGGGLIAFAKCIPRVCFVELFLRILVAIFCTPLLKSQIGEEFTLDLFKIGGHKLHVISIRWCVNSPPLRFTPAHFAPGHCTHWPHPSLPSWHR